MHTNQSGSWPRPGPLEAGRFVDQLLARVVTPGAQPLICGYDVEKDLARYYSLSEVAFMAIVGELPTPEVAAAVDAALVFFAPVSVASAPTHAAVLARLCGGTTAAILGVAAIGLGEQVRHLLDQHVELLVWLDAPRPAFPERFRSLDVDAVDAVARLKLALLATGIVVAALDKHPTRDAAILATLHACGVTSRHQLETLLVWARLPIALSEAFAESVANFKEYPINLPKYRYVEQRP